MRHFLADVLVAPEEPTIIAVDIPIGLPDCIGPEGRGPERIIRPLLGAADPQCFQCHQSRHLCGGFRLCLRGRYRRVHSAAQGVEQLFMIAPKIREVDTALRSGRRERRAGLEVTLNSLFGASMVSAHSPSQKR